MENEKTPGISVEAENQAASQETVQAASEKPTENYVVSAADREQSRKIVYRETGIILLGEVICLAVMLLIYALIGKFDMSVLLGGIAGTLIASANFFFMAVSASLAADKALAQDVKGGSAVVSGSRTIRLIVVFLILFAGIKSGLFDVLASVLPLVFVRPIITVAEFFRK